MRRIGKVGVTILVLAISVVLDQITKAVARATLQPSLPVSVLNNFIRLDYVENTGAFMGMSANWPSAVRFTILIIVAALIVVILLSFTVRSRLLNMAQLIGMSLIVAGGLGNLIDRIFRNGSVTGFVSVGLPTIRTGMFNLAHVLVVVGAAVLILYTPTDGAFGFIDGRYDEANSRIRRK